MKKVYWRPRNVSRTALSLVALLALGGLAAVEHFQVSRRQPYYHEKLAASELAVSAMELLRDERIKRGLPIEPQADPLESGMIGLPMSPVTSDPGVLSAKQTTVNPNFAGVIVDMLLRAGVKKGDVVAVGCSGSFPALNVSVYAALATLELRPVVISSAAASQWGANYPEFLWIDMEQVLNQYHKICIRSVAASIGGIEDRGLGMSEEGRQLLFAAIERNGLQLIDAKSFAENVSRRMAIFREHASGPIKAYINIGGGTTSVGSTIGKRMFRPGLNLRAPARVELVDSVMTRFIQDGVPVIHLTQIEQLATEYGLPVQPEAPPLPGTGTVFQRLEYNRWLAMAVLLVLVAVLYAFVRTDAGSRLFQTKQRLTADARHEPMI